MFYRWNYFTHAPNSLPSSNHQSVLSLLQFCLFLFLDSTCKCNHTVLVFPCLTYFTEHNTLVGLSMLSQMASFLLFYGWVISLYICTTLYYPFICIDEHLGYYPFKIPFKHIKWFFYLPILWSKLLSYIFTVNVTKEMTRMSCQ